jgi:ParB family chromosome partitioning protein
MAKKKRGLGRGLDALIGDFNKTPEAQTDAQASEFSGTAIDSKTNNSDHLKEIPIELLQPGQYQPRKDMHPEALQELADSIKAQGIMQPIVVRPISEGRYEIIAGERRWRASQIAQLDSIPALIKDVPDEAAIAMALIENIQREDLNPMEEAEALHRLQHEFDLSHQEVADAVGKSRATISNLLRLMNLGKPTRTLLENGDIEMGHARAMLSLSEDQQAQTARQVVAKGLSVRQTEALVRSLGKPKATPKRHEESADIRRLQDDLSEKLCAPVNLQHSGSGKGKLVISYNSLDELDGIIAHIK